MGKDLIAFGTVTMNVYLESKVVKVPTGDPAPTPTGDYTTITFIVTMAGFDVYLMSKETIEYV